MASSAHAPPTLFLHPVGAIGGVLSHFRSLSLFPPKQETNGLFIFLRGYREKGDIN